MIITSKPVSKITKIYRVPEMFTETFIRKYKQKQAVHQSFQNILSGRYSTVYFCL